jgi:hypothetical protein
VTAIADLLAAIEDLRRALVSVSARQISTGSVKSKMHEVASMYFSSVQPSMGEVDTGALNQVFQSLHTASRTKPSTQKCRELAKNARKLLVEIEGRSLVHRPTQSANGPLPADKLIVSTLNDVCPTASLAYQQALLDIAGPDRLSWRGPATDLREALRETLDTLAPDTDVMGAQGFRLESDAKRPTMKQKVRFVLRQRGISSGAMETPESAVTGVEDLVGGLTRSVYTRSSVSTHTATTRAEATRVLAWVRLVICELLEIPHH